MSVIIKNIEIEPNKRILVTSDIHGHLKHLKTVLEKASFSQNDILFIVGDIIEKGPESLATLRFVMRLYEVGNVIVLAGNVDMWRVRMIDNFCAENANDFYNYLLMMRNWKGTSFFDEMARELGVFIDSPEKLVPLKEKIYAHFKKEFDFLRTLPTIVETQNYIFVHGGLPSPDLDSLKERNVFDMLKLDNFMSCELHFDKYVIVGHYPVMLYNEKISQENPIINQEQKIISIDGGCGLKRDGQLNLLIIPDMMCAIDDISYISFDELPLVRALTKQVSSERSINIRWLDNKIRLIETDNDFTYAEHITTGHKLWIHNDYINDDKIGCKDCTDYILPVENGDYLSLIHQTTRGYLVKHNGVTGWYYGEIKEV